MLSMDDTWEESATTPGGVLYSLDPIDQERLLAVKFARLVQALVKSNVNTVFLDFPRIVEDAEYLFWKLKDFLPTAVDLPAAKDAHRKVVEATSVRVSNERKAAQDSGATTQVTRDREVARSEVDLIALRREIARSKAELRDADSAVKRHQEAENRLRQAEEQAREAEVRRHELQTHSARLEATISRLRARTLKGIIQKAKVLVKSSRG
jgi:hypothetical protein